MFHLIPLFAGLSDVERQTLEAHAQPKTYRRNTVIIEQGDNSNALYVLVAGKVRIYVTDDEQNDERKELLFNVLDQPGAYFGELALVGNTERTASVMTMEDSKFLVISKLDFMTCLAQHPQLALNLIRDLVAQIKNLSDRIKILALNDVYGRVVALLNELGRDEAGRYITGPMTQQDIAQMTGASREMISRIFKQLKQGGYISVESKRIVLLKKLPLRW